ncbi:MAG: hypothetical protein K9M03_04590 [Kiritimatiellales bacterium]|nr:hypothetical protein [Kiritimatiellales bacterium]
MPTAVYNNHRLNLRLSDPLVGGDGSSIDRSNYLAEDKEMDRGLARAGRLAYEALKIATDARAVAVVASRDTENIQLGRFIAQQNALIAMGNAASDALEEAGDTGNMGPDDVITYISEEIASIGDWVNLIKQDEELVFGRELEKALAEYLNENGSEGSLDKWYATAGEGPIDVSWTVSVKEEGAYALHIKGLPSWGFNEATLSIASKTMNIVRDASGYRGKELIALAPGNYSFSMNNISVSANTGVEDGRFMLTKVDNLAPTIEATFETKFIADHPTTLSENSKFSMYDLEGSHEITGVTALAKHFAPILHFHADEQYRPVSAEDVWNQVGGDTNLNGIELDLSNIDESKLRTAIYSNVLQQDDNNLAINYFFYYPKSNWQDYGGQNNHEGDWEGVTIFFIKSNLEGETFGKWIPTKAAMAQHVDIADNLANHINSDGGDYVNWGDTIMNIENSHPHLYVGLGSHATFAYSDQTTFGGKIDDHTSTDDGLDTSRYIVNLDRMGNESSPSWMQYQGLWGSAGNIRPGTAAPSGLAFWDSSYGSYKNRWFDPWEWSQNFNNTNNRL